MRVKLVFAVKTLDSRGGGAERVLATVASGLAARGHDVTVVTCQHRGDPSFYAFDERVRVAYLDVPNAGRKTSLRDLGSRVRALRTFLRSHAPDVAIGFMHSIYVPLALAAIGTGCPVVASEHTSPEHYVGRERELAMLALVPLMVRRMTVVSEQVRRSFSPWFRWRMSAVPNPVDLHVGHPADARGGDGTKTLLSVGRLEVEKDHATLVSAFSRLAPQFPDWVLRIVGEGSLEPALREQVVGAGLSSRVQFAGFRSDIDAEYRAAQLFVLPSRYESFGLVLAEARLHQLPIVGFASCPGTNQLVRDGENGRLVPNGDRVEQLTRVLRDLMSNPELRARLAGAPNDWIIQLFDRERILDRWEELLGSVVAKHRVHEVTSSS